MNGMKRLLKPSGNERDQSRKVFRDKAQYKASDSPNYRRLYRNTILRTVIMFFAGMILMSFLEMLGFGGFLFCAVLFFLGGAFFRLD